MELRICCTCKQDKPDEAFAFRNKAKNLKQHACNDCLKIARRLSYEKHKTKVVAAAKVITTKRSEAFKAWKRTLCCQACGEDDYVCLDFHHLESEDKEHVISEMMRYAGKQTVIAELNKCVALCANCHRKEHAGRLNKGLTPLSVTVADLKW